MSEGALAMPGPLRPGPMGTQLESLGASGEERTLDREGELDRFLAGVERSAFRMARFAVRDTDEALDIVQDAMIQLVRRYAGRAAEEWRPLFFRILTNRIRDWQRRYKVRSRVMVWLRRSGEPDERPDLVETAPAPAHVVPEREAEMDQTLAALEEAVERLPPRQQQAFLLRTMQGLDVAETARAMGCSQGSVKTHYSRAVHALRAGLGGHWS